MLRNKKTPLNYLTMTPMANFEHIVNEKGLIDVLVPKFTDRVLGKILQPRLRNKYIRANLDEFGSETWLLINGNNKVSEIADKLTEKFGDKIQPVHQRLTIFLTQLYNAGFITFLELKKGK